MSTLVLQGGTAFINREFIQTDILVEDGYIADIDRDLSVPPQAEVIDTTNMIISPGFIDIHFHGCMGHDFCDAHQNAISTIARAEANWGVTSICPATMTFPEEVLSRIMKTAAEHEETHDEARLVGINMEGPFISPDKVGAQNPTYVQRCDIAMMKRLMSDSNGLVKIVDIAPEEDGALDFIRSLSDDVRVSIAHTCASYEEACAAFEAGASHVTHCYNAMPSLHHRKPGPIPAASEHDNVTPEIIADGIHIAPAMVRLAFKIFSNRMILISDSMMATGMDDGTYELGGQEVTVHGQRATLADGTLAGSVTHLADCVRIAITEMGISPEEALYAATYTPAYALGIENKLGRIDRGYLADFVLLSEDYVVKHVILKGKKLR